MRQQYFSILIDFLLTTVLLLASLAATAQPAIDPVLPLLQQIQSPDLPTRVSGFYALLGLAPLPASNDYISIEVQVSGLLNSYPNDAQKIKSSLIGLLTLETTDTSLNTLMTTDEDESPADFHLDVVESVAAINDPQTIPSLLGAIVNGAMVTNRLASFGPPALDPVLTLVYNSDDQTRAAAAYTLLTMLNSPQYSVLFVDSTSQSKIRAGLEHAVASFGPPDDFYRISYQADVAKLPPIIAGDLNGDGLVNCADLGIIKAAFGKSVGQTGFDIRADVNRDGVVNILDLSAEAKLLPAGTKCQ